MGHVFVSYAHKDAHILASLTDRLHQAGIEVWSDKNIPFGGKWREEIERMIKEAYAVVLVMTPQARDSPYVNFEWAFAMGTGVKVIPILFEATKLDEPLDSFQYLNFTDPAEQHWEPLIEDLRLEQQAHMLEKKKVHQVHRYSGIWQVENSFSIWRGSEITGDNKVFWHGKSFLFLSPDGKRGSGAQVGKLFVALGSYRATFKNANLIERAYILEDGTLRVSPKVLYWECEETNGEPPPETKFARKLTGSGDYDIELKLISEDPMVLQGPHRYKEANKIYQLAEETHEYLGF